MRLTPAVRISFGLVSLTISLLLLGQLLGLAPDRTKGVLESRKNLAESLAIQFSAAARRGDFPLIKETLRSLVARDNDIMSAAMRTIEGDLLAEAGEHLTHWKPASDGRSTPTHVQIPIFKGNNRWATVEVSFAPLWVNNIVTGFKNSYLSLILFIACTGFAGYFLLIKRTLRELDPSAVVPGRVKAAFDMMKEGILILDEKEQIVLANASFAETIGKSSSNLIGFKGSELGWQGYKSPQQMKLLPWMQVLNNDKSLFGVRMVLAKSDSALMTFVVNAAPILDGKEKHRGVLVTFDDVSELEEKNLELHQIVNKLELTTKEVQTTNKKLEFLASHDPMTHLLNRRALNQQFDQLFTEAQNHGLELSCIMCDIDHFKSVNDRYGHTIGDTVIKMVAAVLQKNSRENDLVGRYGGEEFCLILQGINTKQAFGISDRMRQAIKEDSSTGVHITMSFGISSMKSNAPSPSELINQADKALYIAKESGRNRVISWGDEEVEYFVADDVEKSISSPNDAVGVELENPSLQVVSQNDTIENENEIDRLTVRLQEAEAQAEKRAQELKHFSIYDVRTGLPTRTLFYDRVLHALKRGLRYDSIVAVLVISVDTVKRVNETLGYAAGNQLFKDMGKRLTETLRGVDTVAQLPSSSSVPTVSQFSQEEFGILLTDLEEVDAITWIVKRIMNAFEQSFNIDGNEIYTSTNIGISIYPFDGESPEVLEKNAAAARSYAKNRLGKNQYYFYSESIHAISTKHLLIESKLHNAIKNDEFLLHYQPKIDTKTGLIKGTEALIRWEDPESGLVPPFDFIPIAEYSGLIEPIGEWVLVTACKQVRAWLDMGIEDCSVAVNFSTRQFRQKDLATTIRKTLEENKLDPSHLLVEITESILMANINYSLKIIREIHDLGVGIALDDFGTGYSSFGYLKNLPLTHVKIDRSFLAEIVTNEKDAELVNSIINMAHGMGLKVTAEGVENEAQVELLHNFGCDEMQGFLFSKPVPEHEATELLQNRIKYPMLPWTERIAA